MKWFFVPEHLDFLPPEEPAEAALGNRRFSVWLLSRENLAEDRPSETISWGRPGLKGYPPRPSGTPPRRGLVRYIFSGESLGEELPPEPMGAEPREPIGPGPPLPRRNLLRWLLSREALPVGEVPEVVSGGRQGLVRYIFGPETLSVESPVEEPVYEAPSPARQLLKWLLSREEMPMDETPEAAPGRRHGLAQYILSPETLDKESPAEESVYEAPRPARQLLRWLLSREELPEDEAPRETGLSGTGMIRYILSREELGEGIEQGPASSRRPFVQWLSSRKRVDDGTERDDWDGPGDV